MKTVIITLVATLALIVVLFGCTAGNKSPNTTANEADTLSVAFESVSVSKFAEIISDTANVIRLDVRTADEYNAGHIENAMNIDVLQDNFENNALSTLPKDKTIALYCRSGKRSKKAAEILSKNGYKVVELGTGYNSWK